ncbi:hypothetical protein H2200_006998 [Cladophialophora chaetospira]|uniref:Uncharacterized protein n=1 Tax=Cladophialophora chaetospira TaxID=386627 RepID=A0AA38X995_9EURO|nr:hypothetical protein H2200_006998 [Cladophialophora chaetospira]
MAPKEDSNEHGAGGEVNANNSDTDQTGEPSNAKPASTDHAAATTEATKADKQELIVEYARLLYSRVEDKLEAEDPYCKVANMHSLLISSAQRWDYKDIDAFHSDYITLYHGLLGNSSELARRVGMEQWQFEIAGRFWWPFCYKLPTQEKRQAYLREVVELVKDEERTPYDLYHTARKLRKVYDPEVDLDTDWVEEDELESAMAYMG